MKKIIILLSVFTLSFSLWGQPVNVKMAQQVAENFYALQHFQKSHEPLQLYCTQTGNFQKSADQAIDYYVFTGKEKGFVIVAGDQRIQPVIAYSTTNSFDTTDMPENIRWWLQSYQSQIQYVRQQTAEERFIHPEWTLYSQQDLMQTRKTSASVSPLVATQWNQTFPYYNNCPYDNTQSARCVTGCVATAMAQILKYWNYPAKGVGSHTYTHSTYGSLSANFGNTTYQWNDMTNTYNKNSSSTAQSAVATLMYHCGVSVNMNYSPTSSGAVTLMDDYSVQYYGYCDARTALMRYFDCDTVIGYYRDYYDSATWNNLLKSELNAGKPILYAGSSPSSGHAFVCDGYENDCYFHMNWGWGGSSDGFFLLSLLNPSALGTGGGSGGGFNTNQRALFVTAFTDTNVYDLRISSQLYMKDTLIDADSNFTVQASIYNYGKAFNGNIGVAIYKSTGVLVDYMDIKTNQTLSTNSALNLSFSSTHFNNLTKGRYFAVVTYKSSTSNRWKTVGNNGSYTNRIYFTITSDENFILQKYSPMYISDNPVNYNTAFYFYDSVVNYGESFSGYVGVAIYNEQDSLLQVVGKASISLGHYYFISMTYNVSASSDLHSGNYVARTVYSTNGSTWKVIDGGVYTNKINFSVTGRELTLYKELACNRDSLAYKEAFSITANVKNNSPASYKGDFAIFIFDENGNIVDTLDIKTNQTVSANRNKQMEFSSTGSEKLRKGHTYTASVFYTNEYNEWSMVDGGVYANSLTLYVGGVDIDMTVKSLSVSSNPVVYQSSFSFKAAIINNGVDTYHGAFKIFVYNSAGESVFTTDSIPYDLNHLTTVTLTYNLSGISVLTAGDYQATVKYLENGQWLAVPEGEASHTISFKVSGNGIGENSDLTMLPYPNPTADKLYLQLPEKSTVSLTDASGKLLFQAEMQGEEVCIDLSGYSNGIYLLRILSADGKQRAYTCRKR